MEDQIKPTPSISKEVTVGGQTDTSQVNQEQMTMGIKKEWVLSKKSTKSWVEIELQMRQKIRISNLLDSRIMTDELTVV